MATLLTIKNADFSVNAIGFAAPVAAGLVGWFFLGGGTAAAVQKDLAFQSDAVIIGAPVFGAGFTSFSGTAGLQTSVAETSDMTAIIVARSNDTFASGPHQPTFFSNYTQPGVTLEVSGSGTGGAPAAQLTAYAFNGTQAAQNALPTTLNVPGLNAFKALSYSISTPANLITLADLTDGTSATFAFAPPRVLNAGVQYRIGAPTSGSLGSGNFDVAFAAFYNRALSAVEQATVYAFVKNYLNVKFGITV